MVLLPDTGTSQAAIAAEKIRVAIAPIAVPGVERNITASLGIATIPEHASDGDQLVRGADHALYVAKTTDATDSKSPSEPLTTQPSARPSACSDGRPGERRRAETTPGRGGGGCRRRRGGESAGARGGEP